MKTSVYRSARHLVVPDKDTPVCFVSDDCYGAEVYAALDRPYNTPFVGISLMPPCYIELLRNFRHYMSCDLEFIESSRYERIHARQEEIGRRYPIAELDGIELQFEHYQSVDEAREKWQRRVERIDYDNLFIKYDCGKNDATKELLEDFVKLPHPNKVAIGRPADTFPNPQVVPARFYTENGAGLFRRSLWDLDMKEWFESGRVRAPSLRARLFLYAFMRNDWRESESEGPSLYQP
jgi:uncharacterized protein (DUF1919 family)